MIFFKFSFIFKSFVKYLNFSPSSLFLTFFSVSSHPVNIISAISLVAMIITIRIANVGEKSIVRTSVIFHNFIFMLSSPPSLPGSVTMSPFAMILLFLFLYPFD